MFQPCIQIVDPSEKVDTGPFFQELIQHLVMRIEDIILEYIFILFCFFIPGAQQDFLSGAQQVIARFRGFVLLKLGYFCV